MTPTRPPYTGPIWKDHPTVADWIKLPFAVVFIGVSIGLVAALAFMWNPKNEGLETKR